MPWVKRPDSSRIGSVHETEGQKTLRAVKLITRELSRKFALNRARTRLDYSGTEVAVFICGGENVVATITNNTDRFLDLPGGRNRLLLSGVCSSNDWSQPGR